MPTACIYTPFAFWVKNGKYGSAKADIDRIIEVLIKRGLGKKLRLCLYRGR